MRKTGKRIKVNSVSRPIIIGSQVKTEATMNLEILERMCVQALKFKCASRKNVAVLEGVYNILYVALSMEGKSDTVIRPFLDKGLRCLFSVCESDTVYYGTDENATKVLANMVNYSKAYWLTKSIDFFGKCATEVHLFNARGR